jgi:chitinase
MAVAHEPQTQQSKLKQDAPLEPPAPQLSPLRVLMLLIVLAGAAFGVFRLVSARAAAADAKSTVAPVYAPYVDVTLTPVYQFQLPSEDPVSSVYLGFIVSDSSSPCTPSWGGYYTLAQADTSLNLGARIAQLAKQGGSARISFGGRDNNELAVACTSTTALEQAYLAPIQRYGVNTVDFDIEGAALGNQAANTRRAQAVAAIQQQLAHSHKSLHVWVTLPTATSGITPQGLAVVRAMLVAHVQLAGVNVLAMDFGTRVASTHMFTAVRDSLYAAHAQVQQLWRQAGLTATPATAWEHLGVTVMLGVNDVSDEHFTVADARSLATFANREGISRVSAWSLNRDSECGSAYPVTGIVSNTCSGVLQSPLEFTKIFSRLRGTKTARSEQSSAAAQALQQTTTTDNPSTSPYPIWQASAAYVAGYKVVWQDEIYQANWWSQGDAPGSTAASSTTAGPWLLIGPVPAGSTAYTPSLLVSATQPAWSATTVYREGQRVSFHGLPYQARWYSKGNQPLDELPSDPNSPWQPLFTAPGEPTDTGIGSGTSQ